MKDVAPFGLLLVGIYAAHAAARQNIDCSTVPPRDSVQLTIYNSADLTLVRERRTLPFAKGVNPLQYSWANTLIDPTSVRLRFQTRADQLELLDTTYPHDKPQMLYWNVRSDFDGDATVEITCFTSGISWSADYVCVADTNETQMSFDGFVTITNYSGEDYANAHVRLVVGTINLVDEIAELARAGFVSPTEAEEMDAGHLSISVLKDDEARKKLYDALDKLMAGQAGAGRYTAGYMEEEKQIIKEGLSEYFIYTIEGTETIRNGWSKRMRLFDATQSPFRIQYRYRPREYGDRLVRMFLLRNDEAGKLGTTPLPDGMVRLYRDNGLDGRSLLAQQAIKYVPIGQDIELNLGPDPEVIHEQRLVRAYRDNLWFRRSGAKVMYSPTQGHSIRIDDKLAGWDEHAVYVDRIRNYRDKSIDVEFRRAFDGDVMFHSKLPATLHDFRTVQFTATVAPAQRADLAYRATTRQGINAGQQRVVIEPAE